MLQRIVHLVGIGEFIRHSATTSSSFIQMTKYPCSLLYTFTPSLFIPLFLSTRMLTMCIRCRVLKAQKRFRTSLNFTAEKNGYLQSEIADYINVDRTTYIRYEENVLSVYPIDKITLLAELYKVEVCDLLDDYNKFLYNDQGKQIKKLRKRLSLTQLKMAELLNVGHSTLKQWEYNKANMTQENYLKIKSYLD